MKTLHLIGSKRLGGAEHWFRRFLGALEEREHSVRAVVRRGSELDGQFLKGLPRSALPMRTVWDPFSKRAIRRLVDREQPAIVQSYMGRATRLTRLRRPRHAVHVARLGGYYKLDGYRHADAWIGNTRGICDYLIQAGFPADRVFHLYNFAADAHEAAATELETLRSRFGLATDDLLIVTPGRFVPFKGHATLLAALARLPEDLDGRRVRLALVGDGPLVGELQRQARNNNLGDRVIWPGWQQNMPAWYTLADLVVFPSRDDEPFGNVILEAWAHRRPLLVSAFRGAREIATHGQDCWQVACGDPAALAEGIRTLCLDSNLRQQLVSEGTATIERQFSQAKIMAEYESLYRHLVATA